MMGLWKFPLYRRVAVLLNPHAGTGDNMSIEHEAQSMVLLCLGACLSLGSEGLGGGRLLGLKLERELKRQSLCSRVCLVSIPGRPRSGYVSLLDLLAIVNRLLASVMEIHMGEVYVKHLSNLHSFSFCTTVKHRLLPLRVFWAGVSSPLGFGQVSATHLTRWDEVSCQSTAPTPDSM